MTDEIRDTPEFQGFESHVREHVLPAMDASAVIMSLVPEGDPDIKYAVELGLSIMLDKPIIAVVTPGTRVPGKLVKVADVILEGDMRTKAGQQSLAERLQTALKELTP
jgi:hypothetical protein